VSTTNLDTAPRYQGNPNVEYTSVAEARSERGATDGAYQPQGTATFAVQPGDTIADVMAAARPPMDWSNPAHREQFLRDNPQFADVDGGRNPDLIWPGEVLYVRDAALGAAEHLREADAMRVSTDSQATHKGTLQAEAEADLEIAVRGELAAGHSPADVRERLIQQGGVAPDVADRVIQRAQTQPSANNPVGGPGAPLSSRRESNDAAAAVQPSPVSREDDTVAAADQRFVDAVKQELGEGVSIDEIKARYGNNEWLNGFIDQAATELAGEQ
jgi:hypothetical protein